MPRIIMRRRASIPAPFALRGLGAGYTSVITPSGARISGEGTAPAGVATPAPATQYPDGTLLQATTGGAVYLVQGGQLQWIPNWATYLAMGFPTATNSSGKLQALTIVPQSTLNAIPMGPTLPDLTGTQVATISPTPTPPTPVPPTTTAGVASSVLEPGAVWNASLNAYVNPDGTVYYGANSSATAGSIISATPTGVVATTIEAGAVYDASIGGYVNPDGSVYYGTSATTSSIDLTSPSTWPAWLWIVGIGGVALLLFKKR